MIDTLLRLACLLTFVGLMVLWFAMLWFDYQVSQEFANRSAILALAIGNLYLATGSQRD